MDTREMVEQKIREVDEQKYNERIDILEEHLQVIKDHIKRTNKEYGYDRCGAEDLMFNYKIADTEKALQDKIEEIRLELINEMQREITDEEYEEEKDLFRIIMDLKQFESDCKI